MDYKKLYEETIEKVKGLIEKRRNGGLYVIPIKDIEDSIPELKESEDEKIRKELIKETKGSEERLFEIVTNEEFVAWLEKQGEHANFRNKIQIGDQVTRNRDGMLVNLSQLNRVAKKDDKVEPKFHEGDIIIHKELGGDYIHSPHKIIQVDILDKKYRLEGGLVAHFGEQDDYELVEQHPNWSEEDEKMYQSIMDDTVQENQLNSNQTNWLRDIKCRYFPQPKQEWSKENEETIDNLIDYLEDKLEDSYLQEDKEAFRREINLLKSLKDKVGCEVNCTTTKEWSEEDEGMLNSFLHKLEVCDILSNKEIIWIKNKFKSLISQNRWKPSEEMLEALYRAVPQNVKEMSEDEMLLDKLYQGLKYGRVLSEK